MKNIKDLSYDEFKVQYEEDVTPFVELLRMEFYTRTEKTLKKFSTYIRASFEVSVDVYAEDEYDAQELANDNVNLEDYANGSCGVEGEWIQIDSDNSESAVEVDNMSVSSWVDEDANYSPTEQEGEQITLYSYEGADEDDADLWFRDSDDCFAYWLEYETDDLMEDLYEFMHQEK